MFCAVTATLGADKNASLNVTDNFDVLDVSVSVSSFA